jgi:hypothetical protein
MAQGKGADDTILPKADCENTQADVETEKEFFKELEMKLKLISSGIVVDILSINKCADHDDFYTLEMTLLTGVENCTHFPTLKLRLAKQVCAKMKAMLSKAASS